MNEDVLKNLQSEFKLWGVKPKVTYLNSGHIELSWNATPDKPGRRIIIPKTGSDWRGWLNARSKVRQQFKQDGLKLIEQCTKKQPVLLKALSIPEPVETDADQIRILRAEVADLSELILELASTVTAMKDIVAAPRPAPVPVIEAAPVKVSIRKIKAIDFVSESWSSTDAIARDMGLTKEMAYRKLYYLQKTHNVELSGGRWRRKPEPVVAIAAFSNGKTRPHTAHN